MDAFLHQVLPACEPAGIYASLALALVMIYQATHLVNFSHRGRWRCSQPTSRGA